MENQGLHPKSEMREKERQRASYIEALVVNDAVMMTLFKRVQKGRTW